MSNRVRVSDRFAKLSAEQLVAMAAGIVSGLTDNPAFPAPTVDLKTMQAAIDDLNTAIAAQAHGGPAATAEKHNKQESLLVILRKLKHYVADNCGNDLAVLLSSGFQAMSTNRASSPLANPSILSANPGISGQLVLKVGRIANARCYEVRFSALGADGAAAPWQPAGLFTNSRSIRVSALVPGKTYAFQVRAVGGSTGYSGWSNMLSRVCW